MKIITITQEQIQDELLNFLSRQFFVPVSEIDLDKSLVDTGIIDSMGLIEISAYIEQEYRFKVTEDMMHRENFGSVLKIVRFISSQNGKE